MLDEDTLQAKDSSRKGTDSCCAFCLFVFGVNALVFAGYLSEGHTTSAVISGVPLVVNAFYLMWNIGNCRRDSASMPSGTAAPLVQPTSKATGIVSTV